MNIRQIFLSSIIFLCLDFIYLTTFNKFFNKIIHDIQGSDIKFNIIGAILCYILLIYGLNYFIIDQGKTAWDAFVLGAVIYGVYETTNYALFDKWRMSAVILDTLWGGSLFALSTLIIRRVR
jgi:uncharacterized membrane protein